MFLIRPKLQEGPPHEETKASREMVLQTMVALLAMGLAVLSLMVMGRWV